MWLSFILHYKADYLDLGPLSRGEDYGPLTMDQFPIAQFGAACFAECYHLI
jgi:hypothetical protein